MTEMQWTHMTWTHISNGSFVLFYTVQKKLPKPSEKAYSTFNPHRHLDQKKNWKSNLWSVDW